VAARYAGIQHDPGDSAHRGDFRGPGRAGRGGRGGRAAFPGHGRALSPGYGYTGIVIAMLARLNPLGVIPAAFFFAVIITGAEAMSRATGVPVFLADVIQGTALVAMLVALMFTRYRLRMDDGFPMDELFSQLFQVGFFAALIRIATPLVFATLGELFAERAGILNLGIEGIMMLAAMTGFTATYFSGSLWLGVLAAMATGCDWPACSWAC
jgi:ABC-type uncharacterized transport system permease subunit